MKLIASLVLIFVTFAIIGCGEREIDFREQKSSLDTEPREEVIYVRVPPIPDPKLMPGGRQCMFRAFLFPKAYPNAKEECRKLGNALANDDSLLLVRVLDDGVVKLNGEQVATLADTRPLTDRLTQIFESRAGMAVHEPNSDRVVKATGIQMHSEAKYGDLILIARSLYKSGADPIVLLIRPSIEEITLTP